MERSERPYVICHMTVSLDGKVTGQYLQTEEAAEAAEVYYEVNRNYHADAFGCGRVTMEGSFTQGWYPDLSPYQECAVEPGDYVAETDTKYFAVAFDRRGRLGWKSAKISDPDPGYDNAHIIEVLEEAEDAYLAYLRDTGISYIFADDVQTALYKLKTLFGIETFMLEGGSVINTPFLQADVIDELSLVYAPVTADAEDGPLFSSSVIRSFTLTEVKAVKDTVVTTYKRRKSM